MAVQPWDFTAGPAPRTSRHLVKWVLVSLDVNAGCRTDAGFSPSWGVQCFCIKEMHAKMKLWWYLCHPLLAAQDATYQRYTCFKQVYSDRFLNRVESATAREKEMRGREVHQIKWQSCWKSHWFENNFNLCCCLCAVPKGKQSLIRSVYIHQKLCAQSKLLKRSSCYIPSHPLYVRDSYKILKRTGWHLWPWLSSAASLVQYQVLANISF